MKNIWKLLAVLAVAGGLAACNKGPDVPTPTDFSGGCEAVDLGLSVKWASFNVGAAAPEEDGSHFAWGETAEKEKNYDWSQEGRYKWGVYDKNAAPLYGMTKYTSDAEGGDGLTTLLPEDDPATANWGTKWRTPTFDEIRELLDRTKCIWTWDAEKKGYTVTGSTGNSIFLPAAGYRYASNDYVVVGTHGNYWSSSVDKSSLNDAYIISFHSEEISWDYTYRCCGLSVRPVTEYQ